jgi:hypothetical protein
MLLLSQEEIRKLKMPEVLDQLRLLSENYDLEMPLTSYPPEALDEVDDIANMLSSLLDQKHWLEDPRYTLQHSQL